MAEPTFTPNWHLDELRCTDVSPAGRRCQFGAGHPGAPHIAMTSFRPPRYETWPGELGLLDRPYPWAVSFPRVEG